MTRKKTTAVIPDFPYGELEFCKPADELLTYISQFYVRLYGDKPTREQIVETAKAVLETRI